mgnify:CR=1 FL=1
MLLVPQLCRITVKEFTKIKDRVIHLVSENQRISFKFGLLKYLVTLLSLLDVIIILFWDIKVYENVPGPSLH